MGDCGFHFSLFEITVEYYSGLEGTNIPSSLSWSLAIGHWETFDHNGNLLSVGSQPTDFDFLSLRPLVIRLIERWEDRD